MLQVVNRLRCGAHLGGPGGSHHFCALASCECPVLGKFMGRAPAAAVQFLWRFLAGPRTRRPGRSPTRKESLSPPAPTHETKTKRIHPPTPPPPDHAYARQQPSG